MGVFKRPGSNKWQMRYYYKGKIHTKSAKTTNKRIAQKKLEIIKAEINQGKYKLIAKEDQISLEDYAEQFIDWVRIHRKPTTFKRYKISLNQLLEFFGHIKLRDIDKKDIERYQKKRSEVVSGSTINRDLACLKKLFNRAIADGYCEKNTVVGVEFDKEPLQALNYLKEKEAIALINACDTIPIKIFVTLGLNTGMRYEELLSLRWVDLNFDDRAITLRSTKKGGDDTVPMNNTVFTLLTSLERKSDYVIHKKDGKRYKNIRKSWNRVVKLAGLNNCSPHILRHTFGTTLHRRGVDLLTLKELGRWSDLKLLERYVHVGKEHRTRKISVLDESFGGDAIGDAVDENSDK